MNPWDWQNQPTMNSQGFANPLTSNIQGAYGQMNGDQNAFLNQQQSSWSKINGLQNQQKGLSGMDQGGYPAMANSYGLGSQQGVQAAATANTNQTPQNNAVSNASAGFNPWSMSGEANSR